MKWVTYDEVENAANYHRQPYEIDFGTAEERKYKEPFSGVRVYENGVVSVANHGDRHPGWRNTMRDRFGVEFLYPKELVGKGLLDPDTGKRVTKTALPASLVYYDRERGRIYHVNRGQRLEFVSPHAQPSCDRFTYTTHNAGRTASRLAELAPHFLMGDALLALGGLTPDRWLGYALRAMLEEGRLPEPTLDNYKGICTSLAANRREVVRKVRDATRNIFHPKYLTVTEV